MAHAIAMDEPGGPEVLRYRDIPTPIPGHAEVLVRPHAIGVNFIDIYRRQGVYPVSLPHIPGMEGAGEVVARGLRAGGRADESGGGGGLCGGRRPWWHALAVSAQ